jgi:hypothetical protein
MRKIISLFQRNYEGDRQVRDEVVPGAEWVINGEGVATRKWDGTCCMVKDTSFYKRYDAKNGKKPPKGFIPAQEPDPVTGHWPGWIMVNPDSKEDKWHVEAYNNWYDPNKGDVLKDGTYELVGPRINGNPEFLAGHILVKHGEDKYLNCPRTFEGLKEWLSGQRIEGIVWHHPDGRMVKIKAKDFGIKRPQRASTNGQKEGV